MIVIVPTTRPLQALSVLTQWRAQTYTAAELCFCPAPGMRLKCEGATVLRGTSTIGAARNAGLDYARAQGHEWAVFWDDDNYHGPDYLAEVAREMSGPWDVLSKGLAFVRHDSGLWKYECPLGFYPGHSTSVRVAAAERFPEWSLSEDVRWSQFMRAAGARAKHLPPWGLVYDRTSPWGHAYDAEEAEFLQAHGPARFVSASAPDTIVDTPRAVLAEPTYARAEAVFESLERRSKVRRFT